MTIKRWALLLSVPLSATTYALGSEPGKFDLNLPVSGPVTLEVQSGPGGIKISVGSSSAVVVHAVIRSDFGRADLGIAAANIRALEQDPPIQQTGNTIRIGYVKDNAILKGVSVTYEIQTPLNTHVHAFADAGGIRIDGIQGPVETVNAAGRSEVSGVKGPVSMTAHSGAIVVRDAGAHVSARNESGGIQLEGIHGDVDAGTTSGRIEVSGASGDVISKTNSASIRISNIKGNVDAHNSSGSVEAFQISGSVHAETASGSIRISQVSPAPIRALSGSGAIRVELANRGDYTVDAQSSKGRISGRAIEAFDQSKNAHSIKGQIGSGGPLVDLDTRSSKIEID